MAVSRLIHRETIPARAPWSRVIRAGEALRIIDTHGQQAVDFLCYNAEDPAERYYAPNTLKAAGTILLTKGHTLYSDKARALFSIEEDTFGGHDTIGGCCSKPSNEMLYGVANEGCRENFLAALARHGLGWKDVVPNVNWFMTVPVGAAGEAAIALGSSKPGDYVTLRARMDVLAVISNCPQVLNPCNNFNPTEIEVEVLAP
jgi:urea carboxylase-associated protein 1